MNDVPEILYEDEYMLAVLKPAGMIVNRADTAKGVHTLQDYSEEKLRFKNLPQKSPSKNAYMIDGYDKYDEFISRGGIVHRLDKETSGIVLIAKNPEVFIALQNQFKDKTIQKKYLTLVHGSLKETSGEINAPIGRLPWNRMRFGVLDGGRTAITQYACISKIHHKKKGGDEIFSLVEVYPQTGRTHQIRVHFQHIGHPIFSDILYAGRKTGRDDRKILQRHFLHAFELEFSHPVTHERLIITSPMPQDLENALKTLDNT